MNDDFLSNFRKPPRPEFAAALYQRINKPMTKPIRLTVLRAAALIAALCAVLGLTLFISPPARAFADGLIHQVGGYIFIQGASGSSHTQKVPQAQITGTVGLKPVDPKAGSQSQSNPEAPIKAGMLTAQDAAGASRLAGFDVLVPAYLPEGFIQQNSWSILNTDQGVSVTTAYQDGNKNALILTVLKESPNTAPQTYTLPAVQDVTVRGQPGVWLPGGGKNSLVWQENGVTFTLSTNTLPLEEVQKVAESLGK